LSSPTGSTPIAEWHDPEKVTWFLERQDHLAPRLEGEAVLGSVLPPAPSRVLDLGCGDGRLAALVLEARSDITEVVAVDSSAAMLERAAVRFASDDRVHLQTADLSEPLETTGTFDVVVSGFAIHHLEHDRKRHLFAEVAGRLRPGGLFANLEVVASTTPELHARFLESVGRDADDPEDRLAGAEEQAEWMRAAGLSGVRCLWRWRAFAVLVGSGPVDPDRVEGSPS
jgi:SAM-dependent methyltransferase